MTDKAKIIPVRTRAEVPSTFNSEDEERDWWACHELTDEFFAEAESDPETALANLELELMRLTSSLDKLTDENRVLKERLEKLETQTG